MTLREILAAKQRIRVLLDERGMKQQFVRQAPSADFRAFAEERVAVVDREIEEIRAKLAREAWS